MNDVPTKVLWKFVLIEQTMIEAPVKQQGAWTAGRIEANKRYDHADHVLCVTNLPSAP